MTFYWPSNIATMAMEHESSSMNSIWGSTSLCNYAMLCRVVHIFYVIYALSAASTNLHTVWGCTTKRLHIWRTYSIMRACSRDGVRERERVIASYSERCMCVNQRWQTCSSINAAYFMICFVTQPNTKMLILALSKLNLLVVVK